MKRRTLFRALFRATGAALLLVAGIVQAASVVEVYKTPACGCCGKWIEHLRANGFSVKVTEVSNTNTYRAKAGIPDHLGSCHTAFVNGYAIEGHVPAADIRKLLAEKPKARGLTVPGMRIGSPGMEGPGAKPYEVLLVQADGNTTVYARHGQ
jgi:hypothetical protein